MSNNRLTEAFDTITISDDAKQRMLSNILVAANQTHTAETNQAHTAEQAAKQITLKKTLRRRRANARANTLRVAFPLAACFLLAAIGLYALSNDTSPFDQLPVGDETAIVPEPPSPPDSPDAPTPEPPSPPDSPDASTSDAPSPPDSPDAPTSDVSTPSITYVYSATDADASDSKMDVETYHAAGASLRLDGDISSDNPDVSSSASKDTQDPLDETRKAARGVFTKRN